jgi:hypothetical protein
MPTEKAIDAFLKAQRRRSDFWKQSFIPLHAKQETPSHIQVGPTNSRDPLLRKRQRTMVNF